MNQHACRRWLLLLVLGTIPGVLCGATLRTAEADTDCAGVLLPHQLPLRPAPENRLANGVEFRYSSWDPRVIDHRNGGTARLTVAVDGMPSRVEVLFLDGRPAIPLSPSGPGLFSADLPVDELLQGYRIGTGRINVGKLRILETGTPAHIRTLSASVRDITIRDAAVTTVNPSVRATDHVVNIRRDQPWLGIGSPLPFDATRLFYDLFADQADFLVLVGNVTPPSNPFYSPIRNDVDGLGLNRFDGGTITGSPARLQGVIAFPIPTFFDLSGRIALHEIAHRWVNFLRDVPPLSSGRSHWPISDLAIGMIGISLPSGAGGMFPFRLKERDGGYLLQSMRPADRYNRLELYLMGLVGPEDAGEHFVFVDQDQRDQLHDGGFLAGPVERFGITEITDVVGDRLPATGESPRGFRVATIVLSAGRLLTDDEMSFYEQMAARGERSRRYRDDGDVAIDRPQGFARATGGRATLSALIPPLRHD